MGLFLQQVRILIWKNCLCRVRQPILFLSEMLWPCVLFLILAAVRSYEPPMHIKNCYLEPRNLPSHGIFPFIQSLLCNEGSRCKDKVFSSEDSNNIWNLEEEIMKIEESVFNEIQGLSKDILEATEKFSDLYNIWAKAFNFSGSSVDTSFILAYLNLTEKLLLDAEKIQKQMYFWDVAALPWPNGSFIKPSHSSKLVFPVDEFLKITENLFKKSAKTLKDFPSFISDHVKSRNATSEPLILMQNWIFKDIRDRWNALWDQLSFSHKVGSIFYSDIELHEKQIHLTSLLYKIFPNVNTSGHLQKLIMSATETYNYFLNATLLVKRDPQNGQFILTNTLRQVARYLEGLFATFDEKQLEEETEILSDIQLALEKIDSWIWIKAFIQLSDIVRSHATKLFNIRTEALKYVQVAAQLLKSGSMDQSQVNGIVSRMTQMFLNMNNITCEDLVEFFKITFKLQNISIPMDTRMLLCSYFESLHLAKIRNKSESISEFNSVDGSPAEEFSKWQGIHHLLQEYIDLSYNLTHIQISDTFLLQNVSSLLSYILDELGTEIGKSPSWEKITELINQACISNERYTKHKNINCFAVLCLVKNYSSTMFLDTFMECFENLEMIFPEIFLKLDLSSQDNHTEEYDYLKNMLHLFSEKNVYNCSETYYKLNLLNQDFNNPSYNKSKKTDAFNILLQKILEHTFKMSAHFRCLNNKMHLPNHRLFPSFIKFLKNLFFSISFEIHSSTLQTSVTKFKTDVAKLENDFKFYFYFEAVKSLLHFIENDLLYMQTHFKNLIGTDDDILKEMIRRIQSKIQSKWIVSTIDQYMELFNISTSKLEAIEPFPGSSQNKDDFLSEEIFSSEEFSNSTRCQALIQNTISAFMQSILSRNIFKTIDGTLLLYSNISVKKTEKLQNSLKKCLPGKTLQELLLDFKANILDIENPSNKITLVDYLKLCCNSYLSALDSSLLSLLEINQNVASISILSMILQHSMYDFLEKSLTKMSFYSSFNAASMNPVCDLLEVLPVYLNKNITLEDINILLLNYANGLHESLAEDNVTSGHVETVLFFIISRFAAQNVSYANHLCTLLKYPYRDYPNANTSTSDDFVLDTDIKVNSINLLCQFVSKSANIESLLGKYLIFLNKIHNFTERLPYFSEESILNTSDEIIMEILMIFNNFSNAIDILDEKELEKVIYAEIKKLLDFFAFAKVFNIFSRSELDIPIKDILNGIHKIQHKKSFPLSMLKQMTSYYLLNKNKRHPEYLLLFWLNNITSSTDAETRYDITFLMSENSSNESNVNLLEMIMETFINILDDFGKGEHFQFFLRLIDEHSKLNYIEDSDSAFEQILEQISSLFKNSVKILKTLQPFHFGTFTSEYHGRNLLTQLINSSLALSNTLLSISQLSSESSDSKMMTSFIEYLQDGMLNNKNIIIYIVVMSETTHSCELVNPKHFCLLSFSKSKKDEILMRIAAQVCRREQGHPMLPVAVLYDPLSILILWLTPWEANRPCLSGICLLLYEKLGFEDFAVLHQFQDNIRNILSFLPGNPQYFSEHMCILSQCSNSSTGILIALIKSMNLLIDRLKDGYNCDRCERGVLLEVHIGDLEEQVSTLGRTDNFKGDPLLTEQVVSRVDVEGGWAGQDSSPKTKTFVCDCIEDVETITGLTPVASDKGHLVKQGNYYFLASFFQISVSPKSHDFQCDFGARLLVPF
ncbi:ATP-binding cassette sub-family A member 13 [Rana temporaria]|uniref:ATP-binding cassette sub-family A member 13 n=1 Tax=Rana temporaria TaxID=8407 RepID=UPI001AAD315A|nr:ATP-binding cassette sub-family A member 13 [Rana temporaria]